MPKVSVIVPTYNRGGLLRKTLNSVMDQRFQDFEIIVVDDGSTDNTREIINEMRGRIHYIPLEHSGLPAVVRNAGLQVAQGGYIAFLDSDDLWLPDKLEVQVDILDKYKDVGLVSSNAYIIGGDGGNTFSLYLPHEQSKHGWVLGDLLRKNFIITSTVMLRRSLLEHVGLFAEEDTLTAIEDYDLWIRIAAVTKIHFIPYALAIYRSWAEDSIRLRQAPSSYWAGMLFVLHRLRNFLKDWGIETVLGMEELNRTRYFYRRELCRALWFEKRYFEAVMCGGSLTRSHPKRVFKNILTLVKDRVFGNW